MNPHAMEQTKRSTERVSGVPNVTYDLMAVFYNTLEGMAAVEGYRQDAAAAGDGEAAAFLAAWQETARDQVDRLRALLAPRLAAPR
jgi:hypothetical protein